MKSIIAVLVIVFSLLTFQKPVEPVSENIATNTCLIENEDNEEVLENAITDTNLAIIWTETNITGVTTQNVSYVMKNDAKCTALLSKYDFWLNEKYENSNVNVHMITFHKFSNYYFVIMQYNNKQEYITFGSVAFYVLDEDLEVLGGYAL